jgi:hypothetical protein
MTMPRFHFAETADPSAHTTADSPRLTGLVRCLVGHTLEDVERELIFCSLSHFCGNRTCAARALGISIRTMRNKINEYAARGIDMPSPGSVSVRSHLIDKAGAESEIARQPNPGERPIGASPVSGSS